MWSKHRLLFQKIFIDFNFDIEFFFEVFKSCYDFTRSYGCFSKYQENNSDLLNEILCNF